MFAMSNIKSEALGYWYLRLNGFLTIPGFVVHRDRGHGSQETDVDILGVRFPYRAENLNRPMEDDTRLTYAGEKTFLVIAEVKRGRCSLNGPWTMPERRNMLRVLRSVGAFTSDEVDIVARNLYERGIYSNQLYYVSLLCLGEYLNLEVQEKYPQVPQILWEEVLHFIFFRFQRYRNEKKDHSGWDATGQILWGIFDRSRNDEMSFLQEVAASLV